MSQGHDALTKVITQNGNILEVLSKLSYDSAFAHHRETEKYT